MANTDSPRSSTFKGWYFDAVNNRLEYWFNGTKVGHIDATGQDITDDTTARMTDGLVQNAGINTANRRVVANLGSFTSAASNGANALMGGTGPMFVAPANISVVSAWAVNLTKSDVTVGTATSSASFRRITLVANTSGGGSGTTIIASLNATASAASLVSRAFAVVAGLTVPAGAIILGSHLTVGAATADGTDLAERNYFLQYELV